MKDKKKYRDAREDLNLVALLLNADSLPAFQLDLQNLENSEKVGFHKDWAGRAWGLHDELMQDLRPLVEGKKTSEIKRDLDRLVEKINELGIKPYWDTWPATKSLGGEFPSNPAYEKLGVGQRVLKFGKDKWIVTMNINLGDAPRGYFYGAIITAFQSGSFNYFKRCQWKDCRKFFLTPDLKRDTYCTPECGKAYDRADAAKRVKRKRKKDKRTAERQLVKN